jgi:long-chain fatty acid transport protein
VPYRNKPKSNRPTALLAVSLLGLWNSPGLADGIYRNGVGARSMALGGADVAWASDPLGAMGANPAGLGLLRSPELNLGVAGASVYGHFTKSTNSDGPLGTSPGAFPEFAFAMPLGKSPFTFGISFVPDSVLSADWHYIDPPGGPSGTTSYGFQEHKSQISLYRSAAGVGVALGKHWSIGGDVGLLYNENTLKSPYTFQTQPALKGNKVLLDLETSGFGWDGHFGVLYRPIDNLQFGVAYKSSSRIDSHGRASGDGSQQFNQPLPFHYDAEVINHLPQMVVSGMSWKFLPKWRLALQVDWINWGGAFRELPINLGNGSNTKINNLVGSSSIQDAVPLNWQDKFVYRGGLEYAISENFVARAGYCYGQSPVPTSTLTPLTAAIVENTFTAGLGYHWKKFQLDLAYQWDIPTTRYVAGSGLLSGDYSNSSTQVGIHWLALTAGFRF